MGESFATVWGIGVFLWLVAEGFRGTTRVDMTRLADRFPHWSPLRVVGTAAVLPVLRALVWPLGLVGIVLLLILHRRARVRQEIVQGLVNGIRLEQPHDRWRERE